MPDQSHIRCNALRSSTALIEVGQAGVVGGVCCVHDMLLRMAPRMGRARSARYGGYKDTMQPVDISLGSRHDAGMKEIFPQLC